MKWSTTMSYPNPNLISFKELLHGQYLSAEIHLCAHSWSDLSAEIHLCTFSYPLYYQDVKKRKGCEVARSEILNEKKRRKGLNIVDLDFCYTCTIFNHLYIVNLGVWLDILENCFSFTVHKMHMFLLKHPIFDLDLKVITKL